MPIEFRGKGYYIEIRYKEKEYNQPHVHVVEKGTGRSVSIAIESGKVIVGGISAKKQKEAVQIILSMQDYLLKRWKEVVSNV